MYLTTFKSIKTDTKIPISPFENDKFEFVNVKFTLKNAINIISSTFYLSNNFDIDVIQTQRRQSNLSKYLSKKLSHIVLDIDEVKTRWDMENICNLLREQDYRFVLGESKSFNNTSCFNLKGIIVCKGNNNRESIQAFINHINEIIGESGHVDKSILSTASYQAPTYKKNVVCYHPGKNIPTYKKLPKPCSQKILPKTSLINLCLNEWLSRGFRVNSEKKRGIISFNHYSEKTKNGYFIFKNSPFVMRHFNGRKINIFDVVKNSEHGKQYAYEYINSKQEANLKPDTIKRNEKSIVVNEKIMIVDDNKSNLISEFLNNKTSVLKIHSAMGTGKSIIIDEVVRQCDEMNLRTLFITNRISVAKDIRRKTNMKLYNEDSFMVGDSIIVQLESLWKYDIKHFDVVILDEFMSLLLHSRNTLTDYHNINRMKLKFLIENKKVVIADAFLFKTKNILPKAKTYNIKNNYLDDVELFEYKSVDDMIKQLITACENDGHVTVSTNVKQMAYVFEYILTEMGISVITLTADTPEHTKDLIYQHFEKKNHKAWKVLIYTPTLTVGVSNMNNVKEHFHFDNGSSIDSISSIQMIKRSRLANKIHYTVYSNFKNLETDISILNAKTLDEAKKHVSGFKIDKFGNVVLSNEGMFANNVELIYNILESNHSMSFRFLMKQQFKNEPIIVEKSNITYNIPKIKKCVIEKKIAENLKHINNIGEIVYDKQQLDEISNRKISNISDIPSKIVKQVSQYLVDDISSEDLMDLLKKEIKSNFNYINALKNIKLYNTSQSYLQGLLTMLLSENQTSSMKFIQTIIEYQKSGMKLYTKFSPKLIKDHSIKNENILTLKTLLRKMGYTNINGSYILKQEYYDDQQFISLKGNHK